MGGEEQESGLSDEEHQQQADNQHEASIRLSVAVLDCISGSRFWTRSEPTVYQTKAHQKCAQITDTLKKKQKKNFLFTKDTLN